MTRRQLRGACDLEFHLETKAHLKAMNEMRELMKEPNAMNEWLENKRKAFDALLKARLSKKYPIYDSKIA